jgi:hypothetical protein
MDEEERPQQALSPLPLGGLQKPPDAAWSHVRRLVWKGCDRFDAQLADCFIDRRGATIVTGTAPPLLVRSGRRTRVTGVGVEG